MNLISRYIFKKCFLNTLILLFAFSMIYAIVQAIQELGFVGKGSYTTAAMFIYLGTLLPSYIYLLIPLSVLIGVITSMLSLVKTSEYAIMRTSGISLHQISKVLSIFGIIFALITFSLGEVVAPRASQFAKIYKLNKTNEQMSTALNSGMWSKDGEHNIINIKDFNRINPNQIYGIRIFSYDDNQNLIKYLSAESAYYLSDKKGWQLANITIFEYLESQIKISRPIHELWISSIDPSYFNVLVVSPDDMPVFSLIKYIRHLENNHQAVNRQKVSLWNKLLYPISCISMTFIACGFIPNNGRNINLSSKLFIGILIGVAFFFVNKLIGFMATLYNWNALLSATIPTLILFACGLLVLLKKER